MRVNWNKPAILWVLSVFVIVSCIYSYLLVGLPKLLNSDKMIAKYECFISEKVGFQVDIDDFQLKVNPDLSFEFDLKEISSLKDEIYINDLFYKSKVLSLKPAVFNADKLYLDLEKFKKVKKDKTKKNTSFDIENLPIPFVNISRANVKLNDKVSINAENVKSKKVDSRVETTLLAQVDLKNSVKPIIIGREGKIVYAKKWYLEGVSVEVGNLKLLFDGEGKKIYAKGLQLDGAELADTFLYFYKYRHPDKKNFLENFSNFKGYIDVDLAIDKNGFYGKCYGNDLKADFWTYKIPVSLPYTEFIFDKRQMRAKSNGKFGSEPVYTDVVIDGVATKTLHTVGNVKSRLTNNFTKKHFPIVSIQGNADAAVRYEVNNTVVDVDYSLDVPKNSNILSKYGNLDNIKFVRKIYAHTVKDGAEIKLNKVVYSLTDKGQQYDIFWGEGIFRKINKKFKPVEISFKTNGEISVGIIKSFIDNYFEQGRFSADLKYDFLKKAIKGSLVLKDLKRNDFLYMKNVNIDIIGNNIQMMLNGTFFDSPIRAKLVAKNNFNNGVVIDDIDINLDKYYVHRGNIDRVKSNLESEKSKTSAKKKKKRTTDYKFEIKRGKIRVGEIINPRFYLHDVVIKGNLKNNVVSFVVPETEYAKGSLSAIGKYNVANHSSDILFMATDIDSNEVATKFYNLPNQFQGSSYATLHFLSKNQLNEIRTESTFAIVDGFLPNLGDKEIIIDNPKKLKKFRFILKKYVNTPLSKICNIDFSKPNVFYSSLRGTFRTHNGVVRDIRVFSESNNLSMFIEGEYKIKTQEGNLVVWGRHNKAAEKKIKIFKVPLRLIYRVVFKPEKTYNINIDKINQIPPINADLKDESIFRVNVDGNLNSDNLKLKFNDIRKGGRVDKN